MKNRIINVKGAEVTIATRHGQDYISLTDFNYGEFAIIKRQADLNSYKISVTEWLEETQAI